MKKKIDIEEIAKSVLLGYKQSWGQTAKERCDALNEGLAAAKIKGKYLIKDGVTGLECKNEKIGNRAIAFRREIDDAWTGNFESEVALICGIINKYRERTDLR